MVWHQSFIPKKLQLQVLKLLNEGHFGIQRIKQLARTAVYLPNIDDNIVDLYKSYTACNEHQNSLVDNARNAMDSLAFGPCGYFCGFKWVRTGRR